MHFAHIYNAISLFVIQFSLGWWEPQWPHG